MRLASSPSDQLINRGKGQEKISQAATWLLEAAQERELGGGSPPTVVAGRLHKMIERSSLFRNHREISLTHWVHPFPHMYQYIVITTLSPLFGWPETVYQVSPIMVHLLIFLPPIMIRASSVAWLVSS